MTTHTLHARRHLALPEHYASPMSTNQKLDIARTAADYVRSKGLTPVASSVTGSRLRGVDGPDSDVDVLVLVSDPMRKSRTMNHVPGLSDAEGQVQSVFTFAEKLSTSVPYVEFQRSPFRLTDPSYAPYLDALRADENVLAVHAERFVHHVLTRPNVSVPKRVRTAACVYHLLHAGSPLCPRSYAAVQTLPQEVKDWVLAVGEANEVSEDNLAAAREAMN